jgi:hypothetical protein
MSFFIQPTSDFHAWVKTKYRGRSITPLPEDLEILKTYLFLTIDGYQYQIRIEDIPQRFRS